MPRIPPDILRLARNHHRQLLALDKKARRAVERQLSLALEEVTAELDRLDPERFRAQQLRIVAFLADLTQRLTSQKLEAVLEASIREMYSLAPGHTVEEINEWMAYYGYEARPLNLAAIAEAANDSIIQRVPASLARWGPRIERRVRAEVAMMLTTRGDRATATAAVQRAIDGERWAARRIVRTETLGAYNRAHNASLMKARDEEGIEDLKKSAIVTFDARTDQDSYPVHGQVRELEEMFEDGDGRRYLHPPGRPNDREKEIPWLEPADPSLVLNSTSGSDDNELEGPFAEEREALRRKSAWDVANPDPNVEQVVRQLERGPVKTKAVANAIRDGRASMTLLDDDEFEAAYGQFGGDKDRGTRSEGFTVGKRAFLRRSTFRLITAVHEAGHLADFLVLGEPEESDRLEREIRAYLLEDDFREHHGGRRIWSSRRRLVEYIRELEDR